MKHKVTITGQFYFINYTEYEEGEEVCFNVFPIAGRNLHIESDGPTLHRKWNEQETSLTYCFLMPGRDVEIRLEYTSANGDSMNGDATIENPAIKKEEPGSEKTVGEKDGIKYCPACGSAIENAGKFCPECGFPLEK